MGIPQAVLEQGKKSDEAIAAAQAEAEGAAAGAIPLEEPPTQEPPAEPPAVAPGEPGAEPPPQQQATDEVAKLRRELAAAEQRNRTLQGMMESQGPRMAEEIRTLKAELDEVRREREEHVPTSHDDYLKYLSPEEREEYGEEVLQLQGKIAAGVAEARLKNLEARYEKRLQTIEQSVQSNQSSDLWARVDELCPGAQKINHSDPLFFKWLENIDPVSGVSYRQLGSAAASIGDVARLADIVKAYMEQTGQSAPVAPSSEPSKAVRQQVKPPATGSAPPRTPQKEIIKASEIKQFYNDVARGKYRGKDEDKRKIELRIEAAQREGRILLGQ